MWSRIFLAILTLCCAIPLSAADWMRAESEHYVVHAKMDEDELRTLVQLMEDFDRLLQILLPGQTRLGGKAEYLITKNKFKVGRMAELNVLGTGVQSPEMVGAFVTYNPSVAPVFRHDALFYSQTSIYLTHSFFRPNPPWVRAGVPGVLATTYVAEDGAFVIGAPDIRRPIEGLMNSAALDRLLSTEVTPDKDPYYSRFFRLSRDTARALLIDTQHAGMLKTYLTAYATGSDMAQAGPLLGETGLLALQIDRFRQLRKPVLRQVMLSPAPAAGITMRAMAEDEVAVIELRYERVREFEIERTAKRLKKVTEQYPDSALVWYEYAAAEYARLRKAELGGAPFRGFGFSNGHIIVASNRYSDAAAWDAVNRALALRPDYPDAIRLRAEILMARLIKSGDIEDKQSWDAVRASLAPIATDPAREPLAAALYFQTFIEQNETPPDEVIDQLGRAFIANPGISELRYVYAVALARSGQKDIAKMLLTSMLNDPKYREAAQRALDDG